MIPARFASTHAATLKAAVTALAAGLLLSGCYYYGYPPYPGYYSPVVPAAYTQQEFTLPPGASGASAAAPASGVRYSTAPVQTQYAVASPTADYYADYYATPGAAYYPYPYAGYPYGAYPYGAYPYGWYPYPAYYGYGYPSVSIGFGYWGGGGCCWGHGYGWHGHGWNNGWHGGGGGGWHGGGSSWQGSGWHGGGGGMHSR